MSELTVLREIWLSGCSKLGSEDPECLIKIVELRGLRLLSMENCNVSHVPREIENLQFLQILVLSGNTFSSLPDTFSNLMQLHDLEINDYSRLEMLPLLPSNLTMIRAFKCFSLDLMPFDWMARLLVTRKFLNCKSLFVEKRLAICTKHDLTGPRDAPVVFAHNDLLFGNLMLNDDE
nr:hypothetical protein [Tanacetum cinerariifolium]